MAATNPWARKKSSAPRHEKPKERPDPFSRFSVSPGALTVINNFKAKLAAQGGLSQSGKVPAVYRKELLTELAPFVDTPGFLKDDSAKRAYRQHARDNNMLTVDEVDGLLNNIIDPVTTVSEEKKDLTELKKEEAKVRDADDLRKEYIDENQEKYDSLSDDTILYPYLVNVTWTFESSGRRGKRRSPGVAYSVEGVFYAADQQTAIAVGQQFILNYVRPSVVGSASSIIDLSKDAPDGKADANIISGAEGIGGPGIRKGEVQDMDFDPNFSAFYTNESGKVTKDRNFTDPYYRCRIVKGNYTI